MDTWWCFIPALWCGVVWCGVWCGPGATRCLKGCAQPMCLRAHAWGRLFYEPGARAHLLVLCRSGVGWSAAVRIEGAPVCRLVCRGKGERSGSRGEDNPSAAMLQRATTTTSRAHPQPNANGLAKALGCTAWVGLGWWWGGTTQWPTYPGYLTFLGAKTGSELSSPSASAGGRTSVVLCFRGGSCFGLTL